MSLSLFFFKQPPNLFLHCFLITTYLVIESLSTLGILEWLGLREVVVSLRGWPPLEHSLILLERPLSCRKINVTGLSKLLCTRHHFTFCILTHSNEEKQHARSFPRSTLMEDAISSWVRPYLVVCRQEALLHIMYTHITWQASCGLGQNLVGRAWDMNFLWNEKTSLSRVPGIIDYRFWLIFALPLMTNV